MSTRRVWALTLCLRSFFPFRELHAFIQSHRSLRGPNHLHLEGGVSFGIGAFNLVCPGSALMQHFNVWGYGLLYERVLLCSLSVRTPTMHHSVLYSPRLSLCFLLGSSDFWSLLDSLEIRYGIESRSVWTRVYVQACGLSHLTQHALVWDPNLGKPNGPVNPTGCNIHTKWPLQHKRVTHWLRKYLKWWKRFKEFNGCG